MMLVYAGSALLLLCAGALLHLLKAATEGTQEALKRI